jgi:hypothetical protein
MLAVVLVVIVGADDELRSLAAIDECRLSVMRPDDDAEQRKFADAIFSNIRLRGIGFRFEHPTLEEGIRQVVEEFYD